jgi:pilus assembly protein Flp/PilA
MWSLGEVKHMLEMIMTYVRSAFAREEGQGLVEYALILSLVSVAAIGGLTLLGTNIEALMQDIAAQV